MRSLKVNAFLNVIKQVSAIAFPLITVPYITITLQAENYGKIAFVSSVITYFALFASLGIQTYAIRNGAAIRNNKAELTLFAREIFSINIISMLLSYVALFVTVVAVVKFHSYENLFLILGAGILFTTIGADWVNSIFEDFASITIRTVSVQFISLIFMFLLVHNPDDYVVYAGITTFAGGAAYCLNAVYIRRYVHLRFILVSLKQLIYHVKNILIFFASSLMIAIYVSSDMVMLGFLQGDASVAVYSIATKIYLMVKHVMFAIIAVLLPRFSSKITNLEELKASKGNVDKIFNIFLLLTFPLGFLVIGISPAIIGFIAGTDFQMAYIPLMILMLAMIPSVFGGLYYALIALPTHQEKMGLYIMTTSAVLNIVLNFILIPHWGYIAAAITTVLAEVAGVVLYWWIVRKYFSITLQRNVIVCVSCECALILLCGWLLTNLISIHLLSIFIVSIISALSYIGILYLFARPVYQTYIRDGMLSYVRVKLYKGKSG